MPYKNKETQKAYQKEYQKEWNRKNAKGFYIRLNKKNDADIISWLEDCNNIQGYIKELIRARIRAENSID